MLNKFYIIMEKYKEKQFEDLKDIKNKLNPNEKDILSCVIDILFAFEDGNIDKYYDLLINYKKNIKNKENNPLFVFYHMRMHLYYVYNEEYSKALDELSEAAFYARKCDDIETLQMICFQELEISTFFLRNFKLAYDFIKRYGDAMKDSPVMKTYLDTVTAYIYSHENDERASEYVYKAIMSLENMERTNEFLDEIIVRICFVLLNLNKIEDISNLIHKISPENPEKYLIESYTDYKKGNLDSSINTFEIAYSKFYHKKRFDEYWLKYFLLAADINDKLNNIEKAEGFYFLMLEQLDFLYSKMIREENKKIFSDYYRPYIYNVLLFLRKNNKNDKIKQILDNYSDNILKDEKEVLFRSV